MAFDFRSRSTTDQFTLYGKKRKENFLRQILKKGRWNNYMYVNESSEPVRYVSLYVYIYPIQKYCFPFSFLVTLEVAFFNRKLIISIVK